MKSEKKEGLTRYSPLVFGLLIFTLAWIVVIFCLDLAKYHEHGDAFAGLTSPIIGFVSALLIYLSFQAQIKANEKVQEQIDKAHEQTNFEFLRHEIDSVLSSFTSFQGKLIGGSRVSIGISGLTENLKYYNDNSEGNKKMVREACEQLDSCFLELINLIWTIKDTQVSEAHRSICQRKVWHYYMTYLQKDVDELYKSVGDSGALIPSIDNLISVIHFTQSYLQPYEKEFDIFANKLKSSFGN